MERCKLDTQTDFLPLAPLREDGDLSDEYAGLVARVLRLAGEKLERQAKKKARRVRPSALAVREATGDTSPMILDRTAERAARADEAEAEEYVEVMAGAVRCIPASLDPDVRSRAWRSSACRAGMYALLLRSQRKAMSLLLDAALSAFPDTDPAELDEELAESWDVGRRLASAVMLSDFGLDPDPDTESGEAGLIEPPDREAVHG